MSNLKGLLIVLVLFFAFDANSQNSDKWKMVDVYAVDSSGNVDIEETDALMNDMVNNNVIEYEIVDSTFKLIINGQIFGYCNFTFNELNGRIIFDSNGASINEWVNNLIFISESETALKFKANSPDVESGLIYHQTLTKQP